MAEWPDWHPPAEMIERQPYLPRFMAGGEGNPLGARALYLGKTLYRIHGTNQPSTIGTFVSSGCIRLTNEDVADLYTRVQVGTRVVVLPGGPPPVSASWLRLRLRSGGRRKPQGTHSPPRPRPRQARPARARPPFRPNPPPVRRITPTGRRSGATTWSGGGAGVPRRIGQKGAPTPRGKNDRPGRHGRGLAPNG